MATKARTTIPFEEIEAGLLADSETQAAYDALEPAYQIARLRIERGLTQAQLAALVDTKQPSIARSERSDSEPTLAFPRKLAAALGVRLEVNFVSVEQTHTAQ
jgi:DNA-binding XRE family transcriptional regulator